MLGQTLPGEEKKKNEVRIEENANIGNSYVAFDDKLRSRNRILFSGKRKFLNGQSLYNNYLRIRLKVVLCLQSYCVGRKFCWYFLFNKHSYVTPTQEYCNARTQTHTNAHTISNPRTLTVARATARTHSQGGTIIPM